MIIIKNSDGTTSIIGAGGTLTVDGDTVRYKRLLTTSLTIKGAAVEVDVITATQIKIVGDGTLIVSEFARKNPKIDTSEASRYASVSINNTPLNLKTRTDIYNFALPKKRRSLVSGGYDTEESIRPIDEEVQGIVEQFA